MATNSSRRGGAASALRKTVGGAVSSETVIDLIGRLGLLDIAVDKLRQRLESADIDDFFDDIGDYLKRNPEVIVVLLGTITVAVGMVVYLERQNEWRDFGGGRFAADDLDDDDEDERPARAQSQSQSRPRGAQSASAGAARRRATA